MTKSTFAFAGIDCSHAEAPEDRVDDEAPQSFALEVGGGPHGGAEDPVGGAGVVLELARPGDRLHGIVLGALDRLRLGVERLGHGTAHEDPDVLRRVRLVDVGVPENVRDPARMGAPAMSGSITPRVPSFLCLPQWLTQPSPRTRLPKELKSL